VKVLTVSLRSFLRFLQMEGRVKPTLAAAVPPLPAWERSTAPRTLSRGQIADLLRCFDRSTPLGRRDYAMTLCMTELGLRLSEVALLSIDDLDWRAGTLRLAKNNKALADLLGHQSLESTTIYTRVNLRQLRLVAMPWPRSRP
jgi:integrase